MQQAPRPPPIIPICQKQKHGIESIFVDKKQYFHTTTDFLQPVARWDEFTFVIKKMVKEEGTHFPSPQIGRPVHSRSRTWNSDAASGTRKRDLNEYSTFCPRPQRNTLPHTCCSANSRTARWHAFLSEFFLSPQHTSWLTFQVDSNFVKRKVMGHSRSTVPLEESLLRLPQCANGSNTPSSRSSQLRIQMTSHTLSLWTGVRRCSNPNPTPDLNYNRNNSCLFLILMQTLSKSLALTWIVSQIRVVNGEHNLERVHSLSLSLSLPLSLYSYVQCSLSYVKTLGPSNV